MRATIRDTETLRAISPLEVATYLRTRGWHEARSLPGKGSFWKLKDAEGEELEVALPLDRGERPLPGPIQRLGRPVRPFGRRDFHGGEGIEPRKFLGGEIFGGRCGDRRSRLGLGRGRLGLRRRG